MGTLCFTTPCSRKLALEQSTLQANSAVKQEIIHSSLKAGSDES